MSIPSELITALRMARAITVLTGAGTSAESGVPTFREAQTGLWARFRPEDLATPQAFVRDPRLVWEWYAWRRQLVARAAPNPGHTALAALEAWAVERGARWTLITQNVDGLHQRAGSRAVVELHGNLMGARCFDCAAPAARWDEAEAPPRCAHCGGPLRPEVVWFGEALPGPALATALAATRCEVFLSVGTSGLVEPAASLPWDALRYGATVVEVNPGATPLSAQATYCLRGPSGVLLPELARLALG